jgi:L-amino acid N-acyltransferase YncA
MDCIICGKELPRDEKHSLVVGLACPEHVPRGRKVSWGIRLATEPEDRQFVLHFLNDLFGETEFIEFSRWYYVEEMEQLVAITEQGEYIGFAVYSIEPEDPTLLTLLTINVDEAYSRRGVASALLAEVKKKAMRAGVAEIRVPISNDDLVSYVFYHRQGFRLSGIDLDLCVKRHGREEEGFWGLPLKDEFYLVCLIPNY